MEIVSSPRRFNSARTNRIASKKKSFQSCNSNLQDLGNSNLAKGLVAAAISLSFGLVSRAVAARKRADLHDGIRFVRLDADLW
jgi:hypothetical protein